MRRIGSMINRGPGGLLFIVLAMFSGRVLESVARGLFKSVSLSLGKPALPLADRLIRHMELLG